jgi:SAM-dependent methyltransferase
MLEEHLEYVSDEVRVGLFAQALKAAILPGMRVADVGCGSGVLGLLSLRAGAAAVYGIESEQIIEAARESFHRAGLGSKSHFIRGLSNNIQLPEPVDLVVCDHVGYFGFDYNVVHLLSDAKRWLSAGGHVIPTRIDLKIAAVESEQCLGLIQKWTLSRVPLEYRWWHEMGINMKHGLYFGPSDLLSNPAALGTLNLGDPHPEFLNWSARLQVIRDGELHGLAGWFDCQLFGPIWMTNSPLAERPIQRPQAFMPLDAGVVVKAGDWLTVKIMARPQENLLGWEVHFEGRKKSILRSTWNARVLGSEQFRGHNLAHVPQLSDLARARKFSLELCDGRRTLGEIAEQVRQQFPDLLGSSPESSDFVAKVLQLDSK